MLQMPSQIGPYRLVGQIGEGGMGTVFEAVHQTIERRVAIKMLKSELAKDSEIVARFFNEARAVNRIAHPSIVQVSDYGQTPDGAVYLVMEFLEGETLQQRIVRLEKTGQRISTDRLLHTTWQVAQALCAAHDKGIVHRDIKTDNIMLVSDPAMVTGERAKVLDFGIAKLLQASHKLTVLPRTMGSVLYMSPEQCRGAPDIDGRTDVYALGVIFYRALTGRPPFDGDSLEAIIGQHFFIEPASLASQVPHVPSAVTAVVHRMLIKDRSQRPTMHDVVRLMDELLVQHRGLPTEPLRSAVAVAQLTQAEEISAAKSSSSSTISRSMGQSLMNLPQRKWLWPGGLLLAGLGITAAVLGSRVLSRPMQPSYSASPSVVLPGESESSAAALRPAARAGTQMGANQPTARRPAPAAPPTAAKAAPLSAPTPLLPTDSGSSHDQTPRSAKGAEHGSAVRALATAAVPAKRRPTSPPPTDKSKKLKSNETLDYFSSGK